MPPVSVAKRSPKGSSSAKGLSEVPASAKGLPAKQQTLSKLKKASSSGRKAAGSRASTKLPPPRTQAPAYTGLSDAAKRCIDLVRYKLSSRNPGIPLLPELLQLSHYEDGIGLGSFDSSTAKTMNGYFKTFKHHDKHGETIDAGIISLVCDTLGSFAANRGRVPVSQREGGQSGGVFKLGSYGDLAPEEGARAREHIQRAAAQRGSPQQRSVVPAEGTRVRQGDDSPQQRTPTTGSSACFTQAGVKGAKASVLEDYGRMWSEGLMCHAK